MLEEDKGGSRGAGHAALCKLSCSLKDSTKEGFASAAEKMHSVENPRGLRNRKKEEPQV